jgi:hypothetical protein
VQASFAAPQNGAAIIAERDDARNVRCTRLSRFDRRPTLMFKVAKRVFVALFVCLFVSYSYLYLWVIGVLNMTPLRWYYLTLGTAVVLYGLSGEVPWPRGKQVGLLLWSISFLVISGLSCVAFNTHEAGVQVLINYTESATMMIVLMLLIQDRKMWTAACVGLLVTVLISAILNWVDFLQPEFLTKPLEQTVEGRAAGMYLNANIAGNILVLGMISAIAIVPRRLRFLFCIVIGSAVMVTFSRASIFMWAVALLGLAWNQMFMQSRAISIGIIGGAIVLATLALASGQWLDAFKTAGIESRLNSNTQDRIAGNFFEQRDDSATERRAVAARALDLYLDKPLLGYGTGATEDIGSTTRVSVHNTFLRLAVDLGTIGIGLLLVLLWLLWRTRTPEAQVFAVVYGISCLFSHNDLEQPAALMLLSVAYCAPAARKVRHTRYPGGEDHMICDEEIKPVETQMFQGSRMLTFLHSYSAANYWHVKMSAASGSGLVAFAQAIPGGFRNTLPETNNLKTSS